MSHTARQVRREHTALSLCLLCRAVHLDFREHGCFWVLCIFYNHMYHYKYNYRVFKQQCLALVKGVKKYIQVCISKQASGTNPTKCRYKTSALSR